MTNKSATRPMSIQEAINAARSANGYLAIRRASAGAESYQIRFQDGVAMERRWGNSYRNGQLVMGWSRWGGFPGFHADDVLATDWITLEVE